MVEHKSYKVAIEIIHADSADSLIIALVRQGYKVWLENDDIPERNPDVCFIVPVEEVVEMVGGKPVTP